MIPILMRIQIGIGPMQNAINLPLLVSKKADLKEVCKQLTALVKLPEDVEVRDDFSSIIFSLLDNRKRLDTRLLLSKTTNIFVNLQF